LTKIFADGHNMVYVLLLHDVAPEAAASIPLEPTWLQRRRLLDHVVKHQNT
jgi:hypothetical protein